MSDGSEYQPELDRDETPSRFSSHSKPPSETPLTTPLRQSRRDTDGNTKQSREGPLTRKQSPQTERSIKVEPEATPARTKQHPDPQSTEHRRDCERKKVAANWGEDAVSVFKGSAVNTWQALAKLSKNYPNWPRAQIALDNTRRRRTKQPPPGSSSKHCWTKSDVERAEEELKLCSDTSHPEHSVTNGRQVKTADISSSLKRSASGHPESPPSKRQSRSPNDPRHTDARTISDDEENPPPTDGSKPRPLWALDDRDTSRFLRGAWWNDAVMFCALQFLQTLFDPRSVRFLDPASVNEPDWLRVSEGQIQFPLTGIQKLPISPTAQLLFPLCVADEHWVAVRIRPGRKVVDIFDSKLDHDYYTEACEKLRSFHQIGLQQPDEPRYTHSAPIQQGNNNDCGPIAMMIIAYCAFNEMIDANVNVQCCRRLFYALICNNSNVEEAAGETITCPPLDTINADSRVALEPNAILDHINSVAAHLEKLRCSLRGEVAPSLWTGEGLALVSKMQKAASNQAELPSEVLAGLGRAAEYLELKMEKEAKFEEIDALLKGYHRLNPVNMPSRMIKLKIKSAKGHLGAMNHDERGKTPGQ